jgi:hypothetical protein
VKQFQKKLLKFVFVIKALQAFLSKKSFAPISERLNDLNILKPKKTPR